MQATIIFNSNAGGANRVDVPALERALHDAGYDPVSHATADETELDRALDAASGLVVAIGGDGTLRATALRLLGRDLPLTVLPLGTANNIARTFGVEGDPLKLASGLRDPHKRPLDVGVVRAPWGEQHFLEACGVGLYADTLAAYDPEEGKSVQRALSALSSTLGTYAPLDLHAKIDGRDASGGYFLFEALNTTATGPRLRLAPSADPSDGLLDFVLVDASERDSTLAYLRALLVGEFDALPSVRTERGSSLDVGWNGSAWHVDGEVWPPRDTPLPLPSDEVRITVDVLPSALELFLPRVEVSV